MGTWRPGGQAACPGPCGQRWAESGLPVRHLCSSLGTATMLHGTSAPSNPVGAGPSARMWKPTSQRGWLIAQLVPGSSGGPVWACPTYFSHAEHPGELCKLPTPTGSGSLSHAKGVTDSLLTGSLGTQIEKWEAGYTWKCFVNQNAAQIPHYLQTGFWSPYKV